MQKACVIGWPIKHSRSPLIHKYWLKQYGLVGDYEKVAVDPKNLESFILDIENFGFQGCNVTIPHKEKVFEIVTVADPLTQSIGAVNTVYFENNTVYGLNTDGYGFISNLKSGVREIKFLDMTCVVIGAGGASRAIIAALLGQGVAHIILINRTIEKAEELANHFGNRVSSANFSELNNSISKADLLVNTTSLGMTGQPELEINLENLPPHCCVTDIVYAPLETNLLKQARQRGNPTVDGLGMLLHQAAPGFEKWFGIFPKVTKDLRNIIIDDLGK